MADAENRLLQAVVEQLKLPLLQIARSAELAEQTNDAAAYAHISDISKSALELLDGLLLTTQHGQHALPVEPVAISSVLHDVAHRLAPVAAHYDTDLELSLHGRYAPIMAHRKSLESALLLIGYGLIESRTVEHKRHRVLLAAHKSSKGLVAGLFDNQPGLSADTLRRGRALYGSVRQIMPSVSAANGAGIFVADTLLRAMATPLHVAKHDSYTGLATTLYPSSQLELIS